MTGLFARLQAVMGGDETRASVVAVLIALVGSVLLAIPINWGLIALLGRFDHVKERCPGCGRRALTVSWCDENDEDGVEHAYFRCSHCKARYRQRWGEPWEDASSPAFDSKFESNASPEVPN